MRRLILPVVGITFVTLVMEARQATPPPTTPPTKFKAGLSVSFLQSPFFVVLATLTTNAAKAAGLDWLQPTDAQSDPGKQISDIQTLVNSGAKGLIVVPRDSDAIAPALQYAAARQVAVVAVDVGVHTGQAAITVRADNIGMARSACEAVGAALKGQGKVLELQGDLLNSSGRERTEGFERCMQQQFPKIEILARPTRWEQARAADATQTMLTAHSDIAAIYMESGSIMLPGVLSVLRQTGHTQKVGEPHRIFLVAIDGSPFELAKIRSGDLDATVSQPLNHYASLSVEYLRRAVAGEHFSEGPTAHNSRIVRSTSGSLEDLLPAQVVSKTNVNDPTLWGNVGH
jgi:ABC-type sugar transport system substrate-binding protein